jgi:hypothetical protein
MSNVVSIWSWTPVEVYEEPDAKTVVEQLIRMKVINAGGDPDATEIIWSEDMIFPDDGPPARVMVCRGEARAL